MVSIGGVINGGFRLFREQPIALAVWWAVGTAFAALTTLIWLQVQDPSIYGSPADYFRQIVEVYAAYYLLAIIVTLINSTAAFRAVMRPAERRFAFLRIGMDELRVFGIGALWTVVAFIFYMLLIAFGIVLAQLLYANGAGVTGWGMIPALLFLLSPIYSLMIWLHVRLSPALALTVYRRSFVIGEAWRVTRGQFWRLFGAYLPLLLLIFIVWVASAVFAAGAYWSAILNGTSPALALESMRGVGPLTIVGWFFSGVVSVLFYALWAGSVGTATNQLIGNDGRVDYADTFA